MGRVGVAAVGAESCRGARTDTDNPAVLRFRRREAALSPPAGGTAAASRRLDYGTRTGAGLRQPSQATNFIAW